MHEDEALGVSGLRVLPPVSSTRAGLVHVIKKDRLSTRFFAAIFRVFAAVETSNVPLQFVSGNSIALPTLNKYHVTV